MYARYKQSLAGKGNTTNSYPSYGEKTVGFSKKKGKKYGSKDAPPSYENLYYGNKRKKGYSWERLRNMFKAWKVSRALKAGKDGKEANDEKERAPSPARPETPPPPPKPILPKEDLAKDLYVKSVDLHIKENTLEHRTDEYECTRERKVNDAVVPAELVVRRGDNIKMTITFDRPYDKEKNEMLLCFTLGEWAKPSGGTKAQFEIDESGKQKFTPDQWGATLQSKSGNDVNILVHIPANCIIGEWNFYVKTKCEGKDKDGNDMTIVRQYEQEDDITILFNPWCPDDTVYMPQTELLDEYVLNESGAVWRGNYRQPGAKEWNFGQFQAGILEIALMLVTQGFDPCRLKPMSDPIKVSRMIAKMVNSSDDHGVLTGNWSGDYSGGVSPSKWVGSVKILKQWFESGPVNFGQCWVFSCITTTVCRALGIPCRTVTNFASAHDTDESNCIEKYFKPIEGVDEELGHMNSDSVWNFHVWNEVWFARPDLAPEFSEPGWQVIDATPQETSEGQYTCGPCPVAAVRKGLCNFGFDTGFVFSEVNADKIHWRIHPGDSYERIKMEKHSVGKCISTKKPTGQPFKYKSQTFHERQKYSEEQREDLTLAYKPKEGSEEERQTVMNAHKTARFPVRETYLEKEKVELLQFSLSFDDVMIGEKMAVRFTAKNTGSKERKIPILVLSASPQAYTGHHTKMFHRKFFSTQVLTGNEEKVFETVLEPAEYLEHLVDQALISIVATAYVEPCDGGPEQTVREEADGRFRRPDIDVECPDETKCGENTTFVVSFDNPLDKPLTCCNISMESIGFKDFDDLPVVDVPANGTYRQEFTLPALKAKKKAAVYFSFDSKEIADISGSASLQINP